MADPDLELRGGGGGVLILGEGWKVNCRNRVVRCKNDKSVFKNTTVRGKKTFFKSREQTESVTVKTDVLLMGTLQTSSATLVFD